MIVLVFSVFASANIGVSVKDGFSVSVSACVFVSFVVGVFFVFL